jgi:transposase-like protein
MRYPASEKLEIIRLVEGPHLSARLTLAKLGIPRTTFYRWYDRYLQRGEVGLKGKSPKPVHVWNRIPDAVRIALTSGLRRKQLASDLGVGMSTLNKWITAHPLPGSA